MRYFSKLQGDFLTRVLCISIWFALTMLAGGCDRSNSPSKANKRAADPQLAVSSAEETTDVESDKARTLLTEVTAEVGLTEAEAIWPDGKFLTPEITPGGVALFDYDNDGDLDIYQICHCRPLPMPAAFREPAPNRLFRQTADGKFEAVANAAGLADAGYGHGAAIGDVDNDGDLDVYVTNYGRDAFYLNKGDGTFVDRTQAAGFEGAHWSSAAAFFDFDRDGYLDLFVVHFATFDAARKCGTDTDADYCGPHLFTGLQDQLYRNNGDGTFTDVSDDLGIKTPARGWGVIAADLTDDGWPDIYVCNDEEPNQLWVNSGDGTFLDEAVFRGVAFNGFGRAEASMGVTLGDVNGDQTLDLFMTHVTSETNTLYTREGADLYNDSSSTCGTAAVDLPFTGWGCGFVDLDHDGDLDLAVANGRVARGSVDSTSKHGPFWDRYAEQNLVFLNQNDGRFENASDQAGTFASRSEITRGLAFGDLDNDGDVDLVTNDLANRLRVFRNNQIEKKKNSNHWLQVRVLDGKRVDVGAVVKLSAADRVFVRPVLRSYSYLASNDPRAHFGLGTIDQITSLKVHWTDGSVEAYPIDGVDCEIVLRKGRGH
jgi:hypothetical protein